MNSDIQETDVGAECTATEATDKDSNPEEGTARERLYGMSVEGQS